MKILALDTATEACTVALLFDGDIKKRFEHQPQQQAKLVLPMIDELMAEAGIRPNQLDAIAFGRGPGSFTGLRIAAGVTQGIAIAADLPVIPISTLLTLAQTTFNQTGNQKVLVAIDARMQEIYWGQYCLGENRLMVLDGQEHVLSPDQVPVPDSNDWFGAGNGWDVYSTLLSQCLGDKAVKLDDIIWPEASDMLSLACEYYKHKQYVSAAEAVPVYLRDNVAKKKSR